MTKLGLNDRILSASALVIGIQLCKEVKLATLLRASTVNAIYMLNQTLYL
jgi:hypothetical protein